MHFRRGDIRDDGYVFFAYRKTQIRKDGTYRETWLSKENFDKRFEKKRGQERRDKSTGQPFKRGDIREDGWVFINYNRSRVTNSGFYEETWIHPDKFDKSKVVKRLNPRTNLPFKKGEKDERGRIFSSYHLVGVGEDNFAKEKWLTEEQFFNEIIRQVNWKAKRRAKKNGYPHNVSDDYLKSIFPEDFRCPVLNTTMIFGDESLDTSPSLDKIHPEKGYVEGNLVWISYRANKIKSDATPDELHKVWSWFNCMQQR